MTQPLPVREQLKALEQLQELDLKIDNLRKKKAELPQALKTIEDAFSKMRVTVEAKKNAIGEIEKAQRQTQAAIDLNNDRLTRANSKLETVRNGQEFTAANKEIDQLKKMNLSLEEQIKKAVQDIETGKKELTDLEGRLTQLQEDRDAQLSAISGQGGQLDEQITALDGERKPFTSQVERRILSLYDRIRGVRNGLALVPAVGGRCAGCNMMVPPQLYNLVQRGVEVQFCPSCNRILFSPDHPATNHVSPA